MLMNKMFSGHVVVVFGEMYMSARMSAFYRTYLLCDGVLNDKIATRHFIVVGQIMYVIVSMQYDAEICGRLVS